MDNLFGRLTRQGYKPDKMSCNYSRADFTRKVPRQHELYESGRRIAGSHRASFYHQGCNRYLIGIALLLGGSLCASVAKSFEAHIFTRLAQGLGFAGATSVNGALIHLVYSRIIAVSVMSCISIFSFTRA